MKLVINLILIVVVTSSLAQNFEGTIKWKMTMEITDPEQAAKMNEAAQQLNDPAMQAQMAELKKQMENPQMKAIMESNPQMKAMMEKMAGGSFTDVNSMIPKGFTMKIKEGNTLSLMEGGIMDGMEVLYLKDKNQSYQLDRANKTYSVMNSIKSTDDAKVEVTRTSETMKVLNHNCTKYLIQVTKNEKTITQVCWATTEIKDIDFSGLTNQRMGGNGNAMFYKEVEGVPLKMEVEQPDGKITMEVTDISKSSLNKNDFSIPSDFKEVKGMMGKD